MPTPKNFQYINLSFEYSWGCDAGAGGRRGTLNAGNSSSSSFEMSSTRVTGTSVLGSVKVDIFPAGV